VVLIPTQSTTNYKWIGEIVKESETAVLVFDLRAVHIDIIKRLYAYSDVKVEHPIDLRLDIIAINSPKSKREDYIVIEHTNNGCNFYWYCSIRQSEVKLIKTIQHIVEKISTYTNSAKFVQLRESNKRIDEIDLFAEDGIVLACLPFIILKIFRVKNQKTLILHNKIRFKKTVEQRIVAKGYIAKVKVSNNYIRELTLQRRIENNVEFRSRLEAARKNNLNSKISLKQGYVYAVINPLFLGWMKIGSCVDLKERLIAFQTNDPLARFEIALSFFVEDRKYIEFVLHQKLSSSRGTGEWFNINVD
jgi:hypothetical protein